MKERREKARYYKPLNYRFFIYAGILIALLQFWALKSFYREQVFKIPDDLFKSQKEYPLDELLLDFETLPGGTSDSWALSQQEPSEILETGQEEEGTQSSTTEAFNLNETQKQIVLECLSLLEEDIQYGYEVFPDTGYPNNNIWISTDVISMVLNKCGYDLMELIYNDMSVHKEDYPLDIKGRKEAVKYLDFRDVFFQEQFFKRNALELTLEYEPGLADNNILWQPGDIVYFQFDPDNPYKDMGGFLSPHSSESGTPLVIMISAELGKVSEVDVLQE
ncbi:MAG: DUF1287 domain-containing protein, partial [Actinobacteria bacterium]|nr:DUF1287 domain-containing protein [Actinomycetota bacterium]